MTKPFSTRLIWADIVRIFAIFFVVLIHSIDTPNNNFIIFAINSSIAATCVPLFVLLSGFLLLKKTENYKIFYKKRLLRLLLPWAAWTIVYFIISYFKNPVPSLSHIISLFSTTITSFWFLPMIAALYIITPALRIFVRNAKIKDMAFIILLWFLGISILPYFKNTLAFPLFVDDGLVRQTFSYLGFYLAGFLLTQVKLPKTHVLFLGLLLGIIISITYFYFRQANNLPSPNLAFNYIAPGVVITSMAVFAIIMSLNKPLKTLGTKTKFIITSISTSALGIYFIHGIISEYFLRPLGFFDIMNTPFIKSWFNALLLFTVSYLLILGASKIPFAKKFIT